MKIPTDYLKKFTATTLKTELLSDKKIATRKCMVFTGQQSNENLSVTLITRHFQQSCDGVKHFWDEPCNSSAGYCCSSSRWDRSR